MPYVSFSEIGEPQDASTQDATQVAETTAQEPAKVLDQNVVQFQSYLAASSPLGVTFTGEKDGQLSPAFKTAIQNLEAAIAKEISNNSVKGMILSGDKLYTTVSDVQAAIDLINRSKKEREKTAQATVDTFSFDDHAEDSLPSATKQVKSPLETKINDDIIDSQQIAARMQNTPNKTKIPAKLKNSGKKTAKLLEDRFVEFAKIACSGNQKP